MVVVLQSMPKLCTLTPCLSACGLVVLPGWNPLLTSTGWDNPMPGELKNKWLQTFEHLQPSCLYEGLDWGAEISYIMQVHWLRKDTYCSWQDWCIDIAGQRWKTELPEDQLEQVEGFNLFFATNLAGFNSNVTNPLLAQADPHLGKENSPVLVLKTWCITTQSL
jgi:hypothetical protein